MKPVLIAAVIGLASGAAATAQTAPATAPAATTPMATQTTTDANGTMTTTTGATPDTGMAQSDMAKGDMAKGDMAKSDMAKGDMAKTDMAKADTAKPMADMTPQDFVTKAASGGMFEVESSKLALERSKSDDVKAFAQMMIDDHTKANDQLKSLATGKNLTVPSEIEGDAADHMKAVQDATGDTFDATYIEHQQKAHAATIALFEAEAASNDAELADFATKTLPTLKMHAEHAAMLKM